MGPEITPSGWTFGDASRTTAEIVHALYRTIREAAAPALLTACNTLFVSFDPASLGPEQKAELKVALERVAVQNDLAEPMDWLDTTCPRMWRFGDEHTTSEWFLDWR
jgi:hypothetical protein